MGKKHKEYPKTKKGLRYYDESRAFKGYTLFTTMYGKTAYLIDMNGVLTHKWEMKSVVGPYSKLLDNGNLFWLGKGPKVLEGFGGGANELIELDWNGNEIWRYEDPLLNHDMARLENGNTIVNKYIAIPDDIAKKIKGGVPNTEYEGKIYSCMFQEITSKGEVIWEWKHYKHLDTERDILCPLCPREIWGHSNSLDILPSGNILFTLRHLNTICILDKKSGDIIWRWGPEYSIGHPHNVTYLENGNVLIFDNGFHRKPCTSVSKEKSPPLVSEEEYSRVIEVNIKTNEIVWEYKDRPGIFYSPVCGGAQRLPDGNTLICESTKGRFFEVTSDKKIVWEYINPYMTKHPPYFNYQWEPTNETFRAYRYGIDFEGFKDKKL